MKSTAFSELRRGRIILAIVCFAIVVGGTVLFRTSRQAWRKSKAEGRLAHFGLAIGNYRDTYRRFPPATVLDAEGHPMHSWRVLLVPYLEKSMFFDTYNFDEPWDGPMNRRLHKEYFDKSYSPYDITLVRLLYRSQYAPESQSRFCTNYMMIVDPRQTLQPFKRIPGRDWQALLPAFGEMMIVEIRDSDVHWMEPRDLSLAEVGSLLDDQSPSDGNGRAIGGACIVKPDGTTQVLDESSATQRLREMLPAS